MPDIHITVKDKVATGDGSRIVCGNSDYMAVFSFDEEWAAYDVKTARFVYPGAGNYIDVVFEGNACPVPVLHGTIGVKVGVYAGELHTTTSAWFDCERSILCGGGLPADPLPDVYAQLVEQLNRIETATVSPEAIASAVAAYLEENPVDPLPEGGTVGQVLTRTENGAEWADITIPKEYGLVTYDQDRTITVS